MGKGEDQYLYLLKERCQTWSGGWEVQQRIRLGDPVPGPGPGPGTLTRTGTRTQGPGTRLILCCGGRGQGKYQFVSIFFSPPPMFNIAVKI